MYSFSWWERERRILHESAVVAAQKDDVTTRLHPNLKAAKAKVLALLFRGILDLRRKAHNSTSTT